MVEQAGMIKSLVIGVIFIGAGFLISFLSQDAVEMGEASKSWPQVQGSITRSEVVSSRGTDGKTMYSADVEYVFQVDGREYQSDKVEATTGVISSSSSSDADEIVSRYPAGQSVAVFYDPNQPSSAVLTPGVAHSTTWTIWAGRLFILAGIWTTLSGIARLLFGIGMLGIITFEWLKRDKR